MFVAAMLAVLITAPAASAVPDVATKPAAMVAHCLETMDGAVYHGDPSDRPRMKANVMACEAGIAQISALPVTRVEQGPEKLFICGRVLDRAATLSFMGLGDSATALREVKLANLYFRIASGLSDQPEIYREAARANVALTRIQLQTLRSELAVASVKGTHSRRTLAYHKL